MSQDQYRQIRDHMATLQEDLHREEDQFEERAQRAMRQMRMEFDARIAEKRDRVEDAAAEMATLERRAKRALRSQLKQIYESKTMDDDAKAHAADELILKFRRAVRPDDRLARQEQARMRGMLPQGLVQALGGGGMRMILN
jgi:hypothetical protein